MTFSYSQAVTVDPRAGTTVAARFLALPGRNSIGVRLLPLADGSLSVSLNAGASVSSIAGWETDVAARLAAVH